MKSKRLLKILKDLEQLGSCFMHEDAIAQFLHDHHEELWHLGMVEEETIYSYAILALNQELTPDELEVLTELEDYGAALVGEGLALGYEFGILAGREQLFQEEPTQTPYQDFMEMLEALDMEQWPDAFRSRISAICQCEKAIHSLFQSRCDDEDEVEELMQMVFAVTEAWLVRPHGAIQLSFGVGYCACISWAEKTLPPEQRHMIADKLMLLARDAAEYEALDGWEAPEGTEEP